MTGASSTFFPPLTPGAKSSPSSLNFIFFPSYASPDFILICPLPPKPRLVPFSILPSCARWNRASWSSSVNPTLSVSFTRTSQSRSRLLPTKPPHWNLAWTHQSRSTVLTDGLPSYASPVTTGSGSGSGDGVDGADDLDAFLFVSFFSFFSFFSFLDFFSSLTGAGVGVASFAASPVWIPYFLSCSASNAAILASFPLARPKNPPPPLPSLARSL